MENQTFNFQTLLTSAVSEPGKISAAYSAFWNYSMGNQLLAMFQCDARGIPAGPINTYKGWQTLGRQVRKGEKALSLCMPITCKGEKSNEQKTGDGTGETRGFTRFIFRNNWFVLAQTDGETVPAIPLRASWSAELALQTLGITREEFEHTDGNVQGYAKPGHILAVSPIAVLPHKTLFHEIAHIVLGHLESSILSDSERPERSLREVEAESVAYLLVNVLELPGGEYSRGYIQHWLAGSEIPERSAQKIFKAADSILKAGRPIEIQAAAS